MSEISKADFNSLLAQLYEHGAKAELIYFKCGCVYTGVTSGDNWYYCTKHSMLNPPGYP